MKRSVSFAVAMVGILSSPLGTAAAPRAPRLGFAASSKLVTGQKEAVFYDTDAKGPVEIPIPNALTVAGWQCALTPRKTSDDGIEQNIYCLNKTVESAMQVGVACEPGANRPVTAAATLRHWKHPEIGVHFEIACGPPVSNPR